MNKLDEFISSQDWLFSIRYWLAVAIIIVIAWVIAKIIKRAIKRYFKKMESGEFDNQTNVAFLSNGVNFVIFLAAIILIFYTIPPLRALGVTLFAGAGVLAAVIGFASQAAFSNIIGGIFIVIFKPYRVGDMLRVGGLEWGIVEDITLRHTVIKSFQNERYIIPNSTMSTENILNASIGERHNCMFVEMGISYDSDVDLAMEIMRDEALKHPSCRDFRTAEDIAEGRNKVIVRLIGFGDSSVNLRAYVWADDPISGFVMKTELFKSIKERFDAEGIEIPFPYRTIVYKNEKPA
ncbi:MAG: mechanosensitive ion channel protein MscS [Flavobacteriales bacterium]|nr:mechanosensitive ion channel protein MscS [Flavobacteriales bacterium]